jgi:preprotein translocase subunit SecG
MLGLIVALHVIICLSLVIVVLLQSGKGGGLAGAFGGGGGMGAVFGGQAAATFLTKSTRYLAIAFFLSALTMAVVVRGGIGGSTVLEGLESRPPTPASAGGESVTEEGVPEGMPATEAGAIPGGLLPVEGGEAPAGQPPAEGEGAEETIPIAPDTE